jgi:hypothetical protein
MAWRGWKSKTRWIKQNFSTFDTHFKANMKQCEIKKYNFNVIYCMETTRMCVAVSDFYSSINIFKYLIESVKNAVYQHVNRILDYIS